MVEAGDAVCLPLYVAGVQGDGVVLSSNPSAAKAGRGNAFAMLSEVAPWHDALPAVANWLNETPDGQRLLRHMAESALAGASWCRDEAWGSGCETYATDEAMAAYRALMTALES